MRELAAMHPLVLPFVPGCAEVSADVALRQAAIEFCAATHVWQATLDAVLTVASQATYDYPIDTIQTVVRLLAATLNARPLAIGRPADFDCDPAASGAPTHLYTVDGARTFTLWPKPTVAGASVITRVVLRPSQGAGGIDDALYDAWANDIAKGAVAMLAMQPSRPYTNPQLANASREQFERAIDTARARAFYGHARSNPRTTPSFF